MPLICIICLAHGDNYFAHRVVLVLPHFSCLTWRFAVLHPSANNPLEGEPRVSGEEKRSRCSTAGGIGRRAGQAARNSRSVEARTCRIQSSKWKGQVPDGRRQLRAPLCRLASDRSQDKRNSSRSRHLTSFIRSYSPLFFWFPLFISSPDASQGRLAPAIHK